MTDPAKSLDKGAPPPRLLELDDDLSVAETIDWCRDYVEDLEFPTVRRWREAGGKVLGHFQVYFPEELAHAAGMLPVKLRGAPVERREADSHFGSYLCSIIKSSLELALTGRVEIDMFVTHPICDAARNLAGVWARNLPISRAQILYLPQNANSAHARRPTCVEEYDRVLRREIEEVAEPAERSDDQDLRAFARRVQREPEAPAQASCTTSSARHLGMLVVRRRVRAHGGRRACCSREEHNDLLRVALDPAASEKRKAKKQDRIRVVFEGGFCEQPPLDLLIRTIGQFVLRGRRRSG